MQPSSFLKYLEPYGAWRGPEFHVAGVGVDERMKPGIVDRPKGVGSWLLMHFHSDVVIEVLGRKAWHPANTFIAWKDSDGHYFGNPDAEWSHSWTHFVSGDAAEIISGGGLPVNEPFLYKDREELNRLLTHMHYEASARKLQDERVMRHLVETLAMTLGRARREANEGGGIPERMTAVRRHIETRLAEKLTLRKLAKVAKTSVPTLCVEFKRHMGRPPIDYLIEKRMLHGRYLLRDKNLSVAEVAERVGYGDPFQFSKLFKKRFGRSPREDRAS